MIKQHEIVLKYLLEQKVPNNIVEIKFPQTSIKNLSKEEIIKILYIFKSSDYIKLSQIGQHESAYYKIELTSKAYEYFEIKNKSKILNILKFLTFLIPTIISIIALLK